MGTNEFVLMVFAIVMVFVVKKLVAIYHSRKRLEGTVTALNLRGRKTLLMLSVSLVVFGTVYAIRIKDIYSIVYIILGVCYVLISLDKLYIADNGFCYDGKFVEFKNIKKWNSLGKKFFEVISSDSLKDITLTIPMDKENADKLSTIIKQKKNKSKAKK